MKDPATLRVTDEQGNQCHVLLLNDAIEALNGKPGVIEVVCRGYIESVAPVILPDNITIKGFRETKG